MSCTGWVPCGVCFGGGWTVLGWGGCPGCALWGGGELCLHFKGSRTGCANGRGCLGEGGHCVWALGGVGGVCRGCALGGGVIFLGGGGSSVFGPCTCVCVSPVCSHTRSFRAGGVSGPPWLQLFFFLGGGDVHTKPPCLCQRPDEGLGVPPTLAVRLCGFHPSCLCHACASTSARVLSRVPRPAAARHPEAAPP